MNMFRALPLVTTFAGLLLSACGSPLPVAQFQRPAMMAQRTLRAQATPKAPDMQAQYFSVLLGITYTPDGGTHFGFDRLSVEFADSKAKHIKLNIAIAVQFDHFMLDLERSGIGAQPVHERVSMDNFARRAEVARELSVLSGSDEDNAHLARLVKVIAPKAR